MSSENRQPIDGTQLDRQKRIDKICDAFEQAWHGGMRPVLGTYLARAHAADQDQLFGELLLLDLELRGADGQSADWAKLVNSFPQFADQIESLRIRYRDPGTLPQANAESETKTAEEHRIARFELKELIGSGGAGEVWQAWDPRLQRLVAVKIPHARHLSEEALNRFVREGRAAAQLKHPNIISIFEVEREGRTPYIVSQYVEGGDLHDWLQVQTPKPREAAELCRKLAEALHHAHEQGVVHRDLKPRNVLVDRQGQPYIADFGLAKLALDTSDMTVAGQLLGTPAYMAPEQARGEGHLADRRTDVYALGTLLYELLVGHAPFEGSQHSITDRILHEPPRSPRAIDRIVPRDFETICLKAMEKEPSRRYPTAQEMAVDLRRFLNNEPILARPTGRLERGWRWIRRRPMVAATLLLTLLAVASLAVADRVNRRNLELQGWRTVELQTEPPGARVAFVRLNEQNGDPDPKQVTRPRGRTPLRQDLLPGDYLVVVAIDDDRFHEVYRRVPKPGEPYGGVLATNQLDDGILQLGRVFIVTPDTRDMAYVPLDDSWDRRTKQAIGASGILMDCNELTALDYRRADGSGADGLAPTEASEKSQVLSLPLAMVIAEHYGKRLPTESEFMLAIAAVESCQSVESQVQDQGPVGNYGKKYKTVASLRALLDGLPEWTNTWDSTRASLEFDTPGYLRHHIVRGSSLNSQEHATKASNSRAAIDPSGANSIGFRGVRSLRPRFLD